MSCFEWRFTAVLFIDCLTSANNKGVWVNSQEELSRQPVYNARSKDSLT